MLNKVSSQAVTGEKIYSAREANQKYLGSKVLAPSAWRNCWLLLSIIGGVAALIGAYLLLNGSTPKGVGISALTGGVALGGVGYWRYRVYRGDEVKFENEVARRLNIPVAKLIIRVKINGAVRAY